MDSSQIVLAIIAVVAIVFVVVLMVGSLRRRRRAQTGLDAAVAPVPAELDAPAFGNEVLLVAATRAGQPYERVSAGGLGFRARGTASVHRAPAGLHLELDGGTELWFPADRLRGAGRATWTLDRSYEPDGLVLVGATLGDEPIDLYFRLDTPDPLVAAVDAVAAARKETA